MKREKINQLFANVSLTNQDRIYIIESEFKRIRSIKLLKIILFVILGLIIVCTLSMAGIMTYKTVHNNKIHKQNDSLVYVNNYYRWYIGGFKDYNNIENLMFDLAFTESSGKWDTISNYNMLGGLQMSQTTLAQIGINVSNDDFRKNIYLQKGAFIQLLQLNRRDFNVDKWVGKEMKGIGKLSLSGLLVGFHLSPANMLIWLNSYGKYKGNPDANGVYVKDYVRKFNNYKLY